MANRYKTIWMLSNQLDVVEYLDTIITIFVVVFMNCSSEWRYISSQRIYVVFETLIGVILIHTV
jgi:hypothetical protein